MQLNVQGVLPEFLTDRPGIRSSGVWCADLTAKPAEHISVQAVSGAGKTTFVHILYGLRQTYSGSVKWGEQTLSDADPEKLARIRSTGLSIVFQDLRLFPGLTAWENIEVKRSLTGIVTAEQAVAWLERLGLADRRNALAATLSYGERQRVAIVRALAQSFNWLIMDEPFSHLDHTNRENAIVLIKEVVQQNNAGLILADLNANNYFSYTQTWLM